MVSYTIEDAFAELCDKHNLTVLNVGVTHNYHDAAHAWTAYVHWNNGCASGYGATASKAIVNAIREADVKRQPYPAESVILVELTA